MDQEKDDLQLHRYVIKNFNINLLNEVFIQIHSDSFTPDKNLLQIHPEEIHVHSALFAIETSLSEPIAVSVLYQQPDLYFSCTCNSHSKKLCNHESQSLFNLYKRQELRFFFDAQERKTQIRKYAQDYGLENEPDIEKHFTVLYDTGKLRIQPQQKGLLALSKENDAQFQELLNIAPKQRQEIVNTTLSASQPFVVFRQHKYYKHLTIQLAEASIGQNGKLKNPVRELKAIDYIFGRETTNQTRFFIAIQLFENAISTDTSSSMLDALKEIFRNPLGFPFYLQQISGSENLNATSLVEFSPGTIIKDLRISVVKESSFYNISARLDIDGNSIPVGETQSKLDYFIEYRDVLHLPARVNLLKLINFFKQNDGKVIIHESKYEQFRSRFLSQLENDTTVNYAYLKPATETQLLDNNFVSPPQKIIYLSESDPYIDIEPVMKYGNEEIALLSKRQIYTKGIKGDLFTVKRDTESELNFVAIITRQHPFFLEQQEDALPFFYLHKERFLDENWFLNVFEEWQRQGVQIYGFNKIRNNRLNQHQAKISVQVQSGLNWFNVDMEVKYGAKKASLKHLKKAVKNKSKYVELDDGTLGILPEDWLVKFKAYFEAGEVIDDHFKIPKTNFAYIRQMFENDVLSSDVKTELNYLHTSFADFERIKEVKPPVELNGHLRDYQQQGLNWLCFLDDFNFGGCLADDMGLGKTIQVIALLLLQRKRRAQSTSLLVVPTSLIFNWQNEVAKFAPSLKLYTLYGSNRVYNFQDFDQFDIILTTYGTLLSDIRFLKDYHFNYVIADESQNIKNPESQRYKAMRLLKSRNRLALTGTPFENNTFDIYAQLSFACPGLLGSKNYFRDVYSNPIDKFKEAKRGIELQNLIKPFILRRTKKQVASELPDKTEMILYCEMQEDQRKVYEKYESEMREYLSGINNDDVSRSALHILRSLTRLRQICDSPLLLQEPTLNTVSSSKIDLLLEQIESKSQQHKILVFSQFVTMLDLIKPELDKRNIQYVYLTGATKDRQSVVDKFQDDSSVRVFLISLKAGGTGLNLTRADYVYLLDPWWNPAVESQAIDRVYRIGQKKNVIAVRLICPDTVEEKILKLQENKGEIADSLISTEGNFFNSLTKIDLLKLLSPTIPLSVR